MAALRAVRAKTVKQAAAGGDRLQMLIALRARVADAVQNPDTHPRDLSPLARRLVELAREIEELESTNNQDEVTRAAATPDEAWDGTAI